MSELKPVIVIGGGLAGSEAAWQLARRGVRVELYEMRPVMQTPAHTTTHLAELVCSNSFKADALDTASGLLKAELRRCGSLLLQIADSTRVPAGGALAVDRDGFSARVTEAIESEKLIQVHRREMTELPEERTVIVAAGPLISEALARSVGQFTGRRYLYFYDAISPIVERSSIRTDRTFRASRYGKGGEDYLNCPLTEAEYNRFYEALTGSETYPLHGFEKKLFFEGCLPIEEMARRGRETLLFGPMKPVGLTDPATGHRPFAVIQMRQDNLAADHFNLVGFQTQMRRREQDRVLRLIPALENAVFVRYGQVHRNSYINSPALLTPTLQARIRPTLFFAGQIAGVEGYVEAMATGLISGINAARLTAGEEPLVFPRTTALGSLLQYISHTDPHDYQPSNISFGLLPPPAARTPRRKRRQLITRRALEDLEHWKAEC
ncbi:MAG: methylenetetrahydrofolate--tRNA-(uracil(54)-C(5))-methyltransferase (FADH(2)-oxidizing) TrmFO [Acidobacteriota bacterium]|nr:methylenetetrahydrofolate--tRNA-(uracil(54)-C(5))-methyltransferase (FADH(2)-oxidizing) TrmFO [Acidobacteriota bacterium]